MKLRQRNRQQPEPPTAQEVVLVSKDAITEMRELIEELRQLAVNLNGMERR